jgi:hypothetical protein
VSFAVVAAILAAAWPGHLAVGASRPPGDVPALDARYQYLAGGVNTGSGWSTWNPNGTFVTRYVKESHAKGVVPVLTYYMLLQSKSSFEGGEAEKDLAHLRNASLMRAYWKDFTLALKRAKGKKLVIFHLEPDLFGYMHQAARNDRASAPHARFARRAIRLRDRYARNVKLAYHLSTWGTNEDPTYSDPPDARIDRLAARSARFYRSLGARFDYVFNDVDDRDAGFNEHVLGDGGRSRWDEGDFHRHARFIKGFTRRVRKPVVIWQIPVGNSTLPDTWGRYRDSRVEWWLGESRDEHLREARDAGIVALLFGGGADGTTSPDTDGGLFFRLAREYLAKPLPL